MSEVSAIRVNPTRSRLPVPPSMLPERTLTAGQWGLIAFLVSEVALFGTLIVTYVYYLGKDTAGPTPANSLSLKIVLLSTACLLCSSGTVHLAERSFLHGSRGGFIKLWLVTILLGATFLAFTGFEWRDLIVKHHLTISTNLFGTTYYTLVGLHALHVTMGVVIMAIVLGLVLRRHIGTQNHAPVTLVSWYWHFVDVVWVVVFSVVYLFGR